MYLQLLKAFIAYKKRILNLEIVFIWFHLRASLKCHILSVEIYLLNYIDYRNMILLLKIFF